MNVAPLVRFLLPLTAMMSLKDKCKLDKVLAAAILIRILSKQSTYISDRTTSDDDDDDAVWLHN